MVQTIFAQQKLPIIRASSKMVDIRDGKNFIKANWTISPELKPDVFTTSNKNEKVTFYTDLDSISFTVDPNKKYNFIILLNNKDSALTQIIYRQSYLETLKQADKYNLKDNREMPKFTYQSNNNPHLIELRKAFNLDSVAGNGTEVFKILNLLHWIHNLIPHDGSHGNPEIKNAMSMIAVCKKEGRGLNCRGLATVLNECYLALGFSSRFITCLPKDTADIDCHVINMVYSKDLKKWFWIDPTMDAYVMDEQGELLSIEEVRERLISGKTLILNPDANWNHKTSQTKEDYLYNYMAKNLYRFECPINSEYDTETNTKGKVVTYAQLLSLNDNQLLDGGSKAKNQTRRVYKTNCLEVFWQAPY